MIPLDVVVERSTRSQFPPVGEPDFYYIATDTQMLYRWVDDNYTPLRYRWRDDLTAVPVSAIVSTKITTAIVEKGLYQTKLPKSKPRPSLSLNGFWT